MTKKFRDINKAFPYTNEDQYDFMYIDSNLYDEEAELYVDDNYFDY